MFKDDFVRMNRAWIEKRFELEEKDIELFDNLDSYAESGSVILLGEEDGEIIATCKAVLSTCSVFEDAVHIYRREGFVDVTADPEFSFGRTDLQMVKTLIPGSSSGRPS